jgi:hypothetical protein
MESEGTQNRSINFSSSQQDLSQRIEDFHNERPEDVEELRNYIQGVLEEAETTAQERLDIKAVRVLQNPQSRSTFESINCFHLQSEEAKEKNLNAFMSGLKDKNKRVVTRARSLARSLIDTICNCTTNVSNPIQQAATRLRRQQTAYERSSSTPRQQTRFED